MRENGAGDGSRLFAIGRVLPALRRLRERPADQQIAVGGVVAVLDVRLVVGKPAPGGEPVAANFQIGLRPRPELVEGGAVAREGGEQHCIALAFAMAYALGRIFGEPAFGLDEALLVGRPLRLGRRRGPCGPGETAKQRAGERKPEPPHVRAP